MSVLALQSIWRVEDKKSRISESLLLGLSALWLTFHALEISHADFSLKSIFNGLQLFCAILTAITWSVYAAYYSGLRRLLKYRNLVFLVLPSLFAVILIFTNNSHNLVWTSVTLNDADLFLPLVTTKSVAAFACIAYAYLLLVAGAVLVIYMAIKANCFYHRQSKILAAGVIIAVLAGVLDLMGFESRIGPGIGPAPLGIAFASMAVVLIAPKLWRRDILPIAYESVVEFAGDSIVVLDNNGRIIYLNPSAEHLAGRILLDKKDIMTAVRLLARNSPGLPTGPDEFTFNKKDGGKVLVEISTFPVKPDGKPAILGVVRDITGRLKSETELKVHKELIDHILINMSSAVLVLDSTMHVILTNRTFCDTFQMEEEHVTGKSLETMRELHTLAAPINEALASEKTVSGFEFHHHLVSDIKIFVADIIPIYNNEVLLVLRDVTEERERMEKLYFTDRLASIGEMAAGIAHEINNPLTGIIALSQLLVDSEIPDSIRRDLRDINKEAQRAAAVVKNLLIFARGKNSVRGPVQINGLTEEVLRLRTYEDNVNNIRIIRDFTADLPDVMVNPSQIQQVLLNVILNAEQAMKEANGSGTLLVNSRCVNGHVRVSFTDDGPVSVSYGIIAAHGGRIRANSSPGHGTTITIDLPSANV